MAKQKVLVIVGPTASGKSDLAVKLAKKFGGEIISADSRQVYKGLDIGTGKITKREMRGVPHHLLDIANPKKYFSAEEYKKLAQKKLDNVSFPIIVGGTGFYIDALTGKALWPEVPPNKTLRKKLEKRSDSELFAMLKKKDARRAKSIDPHNKVRIIRALEIIDKLGKVPVLKSGYSDNFIFVGLKPNDLEKRIRTRLERRLGGIISEAKRLYKNGLSYKRMYELGLEYRYASLFLTGKISKPEMLGKLSTAIQHYAKRQMTWFKRNKKIRWFTPNKYNEIEKYVRKMLGGRSRNRTSDSGFGGRSYTT